MKSTASESIGRDAIRPWVGLLARDPAILFSPLTSFAVFGTAALATLPAGVPWIVFGLLAAPAILQFPAIAFSFSRSRASASVRLGRRIELRGTQNQCDHLLGRITSLASPAGYRTCSAPARADQIALVRLVVLCVIPLLLFRSDAAIAVASAVSGAAAIVLLRYAEHRLSFCVSGGELGVREIRGNHQVNSTYNLCESEIIVDLSEGCLHIRRAACSIVVDLVATWQPFAFASAVVRESQRTLDEQ